MRGKGHGARCRQGIRSPLDPVALLPGDNTISMGRQDYLWLEASGPCHDRLILDGPGPVAHNGAGDVDAEGRKLPSGPFLDEGDRSTAGVFSYEVADGEGVFTIRLDAACTSKPCTPPLASVHVAVRGTATSPSDPGAVLDSTATP